MQDLISLKLQRLVHWIVFSQYWWGKSFCCCQLCVFSLREFSEVLNHPCLHLHPLPQFPCSSGERFPRDEYNDSGREVPQSWIVLHEHEQLAFWWPHPHEPLPSSHVPLHPKPRARIRWGHSTFVFEPQFHICVPGFSAYIFRSCIKAKKN